MKTVLIPTDYQPSSLNVVYAIHSQFNTGDLNLIFVHVFKLSDSITDLLMLSKRSREYEQVSDGFYERCNQLRAQYPRIKDIRIEFLYGSTLSMFKNFLEANKVHAVAYSENAAYQPIHKSSVDPALLVHKCGLPVISANSQTFARVKNQEFAPAYRQELLTQV
ncbi:hypothetical protein [Mucilaginibacter sp.]|uniref:hypothetical protein n=1 Tax=Mucilaginibacter sp. TaxID=1882438 RepID=UPI0035BC269A